MAQLRFVLLRHSFSTGNARRIFSGMGDVELAPEGIQMVRDYREQGFYERFATAQRYYSSPLLRCRQTFELALGDRAALDGVINVFHEIDFGEMEGTSLSSDEVAAFFSRWAAGEPQPGAPHLETLAHLRARGCAAARALALDCVASGVESVCVVAHSAISRATITALAGLSPQTWLSTPMPNALGYVLTLDVDESAATPAPAGLITPADIPYDPDVARASDAALLAASSAPASAGAPYTDVRLISAVPYGPADLIASCPTITPHA